MIWFYSALTVVAAVAIWAIFIERVWFVVRRRSLAVLPSGSKPITVLHISDVHMAPWQHSKQRWLKGLASRLEFDLVVDTGDNLGHPAAIEPFIGSIEGLLKRPGVFAHGSNDYHGGVWRNPLRYFAGPSKAKHGVVLDTAALEAGLRSGGWLDANNRAAELVVNGTRIKFLGLADAHHKHEDVSSLAAQSVGNDKADVVLGITHAPYLATLAALSDAGASAVFAGHTHGGQVCVPITGQALLTNCDLPRRFARGAHNVPVDGRSIPVHICAGLGHSIFAPFRLACRPEVALVQLLPKP